MVVYLESQGQHSWRSTSRIQGSYAQTPENFDGALPPKAMGLLDYIGGWAKIKKPMKEKLKERLENPRVESSRLNGMKDCYKIKLRAVGYRLVYEVRDDEVVVVVIAIGKRERNQVYKTAAKRI